MTDHVYKSSITGEFVSAEFAAQHPDTTYRATVDGEPCCDDAPVAVNPDPELDGDEGQKS